MKGFTLIEMIVVIGISMILTAVLVVYSRSGERQIVLYTDQSRVVGILNRVKSLTLQTYKTEKNTCAFGVHFEAPHKFIIFQDISASGDCDGSDNNLEYDDGPDEKIEEFSLDNRLRFIGLTDGVHDIIFVPPYLEVIMPVIITIEIDDDSGLQAQIEIGPGGQVTALPI